MKKWRIPVVALTVALSLMALFAMPALADDGNSDNEAVCSWWTSSWWQNNAGWWLSCNSNSTATTCDTTNYTQNSEVEVTSSCWSTDCATPAAS